jgi:8-oxo-dGTP pyrophosphatase MutT (NUDIX family)
MSAERAGLEIVYDNGQLLRVEHRHIPGRDRPYEFVHRVGATVVMAITNAQTDPHVLVARTTRAGYGVSHDSLPGGNADGRFESPEHPTVTGLRELREETGFGYTEGTLWKQDTLLLHGVSKTILYDRHLLVARDVVEIGGKLDNPREVVDITPTPLDEFMDPLYAGSRENIFPEIQLAMIKAGSEVGRDEVRDWMINGANSEAADAVVAGFSPWMQPYIR